MEIDPRYPAFTPEVVRDLVREQVERNRLFEDRIIDIERVLTASLLDITRRLVDIAGWSDEDITAFFQSKAEMLRQDQHRSNEAASSSLADRLEHIAHHLALPPN